MKNIFSNKPKQKIFVSIFCTVTIAILFYLYSYLSFHGANWFFHPDERDVYSISYNLYKKGTFSSSQPLNTQFDAALFIPDGSSSINERIVPGRSLGIYILEAPSFIFGQQAPFYLISICGLLAVFFFYLITKKLLDKSTAIFAALFLAFSPQFIFWNNMLFSNVPALAFLLAGIYYTFSPQKWFLVGLFFAFSVMLRYEFILFVGLYLFINFLLVYKKEKNHRSIIFMTATMLALLIFIPLCNKKIYGSYTSFGYTQKAYDLQLGNTVDYRVGGGGSSGVFSKYLKRFGGQFSDPKLLDNIQLNFKQYILLMTPILLIGLLGLKEAWFKSKSREVFLGLSAIALFSLIYFGSGAGYNGFGKGWLAGSYTRYLLPLLVLLALLTGLFISRLFNDRKYKMVFFIITVYVIFSINQLFNAPLGLSAVGESKRNYHEVEQKANSLPANAVVVSNFYSKTIISRPVLIPYLIPLSKDERPQKSLDYIDELLNDHSVYVFENPYHSSYIYLDSILKNRGNYRLTTIDKNNNFYKVEKK